ncbi:inhibitor of apoptosis protein-like isoform X2 [Haliotis asinina]
MKFFTTRRQCYECEDAGGILGDFVNQTLRKSPSLRNVACVELTLKQKMRLLQQLPPSTPQHGRMWNSDDRLQTLRAATDKMANIPDAVRVTIARAGFYHSGSDNTLTCFFCGCNAHSWSADDDPWRRHAELQMTCPVLRRNVYTRIKNGNIAFRPRRRYFSECDTSPQPTSYASTIH